MAKRLYILRSRLPLLLQGSELTHVRAVEGVVAFIEEFRDTVYALEPQILSLRKGDTRDVLSPSTTDCTRFIVPLHKIVGKTMLKDEEVAAAQRDDIRQLFWDILGYFIGIIASAMVLVALLFKEFKQANRLLRVANQAEAASAAAKAQLTAVIDAVPARIAARDRDGAIIFRNKNSADWSRAGGRRARDRRRRGRARPSGVSDRTAGAVLRGRSARGGTWPPHLADHQGAARGDGGPDHRGGDGFA